MGFFSFLGRVLFASLFILSAWQMFTDFGTDGGPAAKEISPKLDLTKTHLSSKLGVALPHIEVEHVVWAIIALKGLGGLLFVIGNILRAYLMGGGFKNVLVIGADSLSRFVDWTDRGTCILFGDAAGAEQKLDTS